MNMFYKFIKYVFGKEIVTITEKVVVVEVLSTSALNRLKAKLEPPIISGSDGPEQAPYRLGIQRALSVLEKEFTA